MAIILSAQLYRFAADILSGGARYVGFNAIPDADKFKPEAENGK